MGSSVAAALAAALGGGIQLVVTGRFIPRGLQGVNLYYMGIHLEMVWRFRGFSPTLRWPVGYNSPVFNQVLWTHFSRGVLL